MPTRRIPFVLVILATGIPMFMATLDNLVMTNALPVIHAELGASVEELQWFINAYTLVFASLILLTVGLGDRLGRRTIFIAGIAIFTVASVLAALSTDSRVGEHVLETHALQADLTRLLDWANSHGLTLDRLHARGGSLEDAFMGVLA